MGQVQKILTQVGSGPFLLLGSGQPCLAWVWVWKIPLKIPNFSIFALRVKNISSAWVKSTWAKGGLASYLLWVKTMLRLGQSGPISGTTTIPSLNKEAFSTSDCGREARREIQEMAWKTWKSRDHVKQRNTESSSWKAKKKIWEIPWHWKSQLTLLKTNTIVWPINRSHATTYPWDKPMTDP